MVSGGLGQAIELTDVAEVFHTTWDHVFRSVAMAVRWGLTHRDLTGITATGIDEFARRPSQDRAIER